nr:zeta toxin family protein [Streptomyces viridochromogenes]
MVRPDTARWQAAVEARDHDGRFDAVVESALADPADFRASSLACRAAGHRIEVMVVTTAEALSQHGILDRFLTDAANGGGRYVSWENHDTCAKNLLTTLSVIETEQLADRVTVVRHDGTVLYINELTPEGTWRHRPAAERVERARPWNAPETAAFRRDLARTDRRVHTELADEDRRLAVQRDTEHAAAWSEPVRRTAQPTATPPGVAHHRLSASEHDWIFDELITPTALAGVVRRDDPRAVYVIGQPGAGKTAATRMVRRAMRSGTTRLRDDFKSAHPDHRQLLRQDPRGDGAAIRADYKALFTRVEAFVRDRRGDLLIETAPGHADDVLGSALACSEAGYPVEVVVLAVREADSRLFHRAALRPPTCSRPGSEFPATPFSCCRCPGRATTPTASAGPRRAQQGGLPPPGRPSPVAGGPGRWPCGRPSAARSAHRRAAAPDARQRSTIRSVYHRTTSCTMSIACCASPSSRPETSGSSGVPDMATPLILIMNGSGRRPPDGRFASFPAHPPYRARSFLSLRR